jgi:hypothetical protein
MIYSGSPVVILYSSRCKFNQYEVDPTCPICRLETETITHVITSCPLYNEIRKEQFVKIKGTVITAITTGHSINTGPYGENTEIYSSLKLLH